jgi:hypothetical protein
VSEAAQPGRGESATSLLAFTLYAALAVGMTWPLARSPHALLHGNADAFGNVWAMSWVAHQLPRDPWHLFDSNMYFPHTKSLAYAESLVPQGLMALPVLAAGGSAALAYNLVLLLTFPVAGLGAMLLARDLEASRGPAILAGLGFAFCAYRWDHIVHVQTLSCGWLPLALLFLRRTMRSPTSGSAVGLGTCAWLQVLSSGYYALVLAVAILVVVAAEVFGTREAGGRFRPPRGLRHAALALALAALAAAPVFAQHREVAKRHGFVRAAGEMAVWSATFSSWLDPGPDSLLPHTGWLHDAFEDREPLFPGSVFLIAGALGLTAWGRRRNWALCAALLAVGALLAFGPEIRVLGATVPAPFALVRILPGGGLLRTPARFAILGILGLGLLAALAMTRILEGRPLSKRQRLVLLGAIGLFAVLEAWPAGLSRLVKPAPPFPPSAAFLRDAPAGAVLELPWSEREQAARYVYWSTAHWQPLVNGYGSFDPPGNFALGLLGRRFPTGYTARQLRAAGVVYVVIHTDRLTEGDRARLLASDPLPKGVALAAELETDRIYRIDPAGPALREKEKGPQFD